MLPSDFLDKLRCPATHSPLRPLPDSQLQRVNEAIQQRHVTNQLGDTVEQPLSDGLINADESLLYPVWDDIPTLIPEEAIPYAQFAEKT